MNARANSPEYENKTVIVRCNDRYRYGSATANSGPNHEEVTTWFRKARKEGVEYQEYRLNKEKRNLWSSMADDPDYVRLRKITTYYKDGSWWEKVENDYKPMGKEKETYKSKLRGWIG